MMPSSRFHLWIAGCVLAVCTGLSGLAHAATQRLDDFGGPTAPGASVLTATGESRLVQTDPSVLGGVREVYHHVYLNPLGSVSAVTAGGGTLSSSDGVGVTSEVLVLYGAFSHPEGVDGPPGPALGLDLTPYDAFHLDFSGIAQVMNINIVMYSSTPLDLDSASPTYYSAAGVNVAPDVPGGPLVLDLPFAADSGFNYASVDGFALVLNRAVGHVTQNAFTLDHFAVVSTVPENPSAALVLAGLGTLGWVARRRRPA